MNPLRRTLAVGCLAALLTGPVGAQNLLEQGANLLKGLGSSVGSALGGDSLGEDEIARGLKEALSVGVDKVVGQLGTTNGFNADPAVRIPLPDTLQSVRSALSPFGMSGMLDDLETRMNRAAEDATPKAFRLFGKAISEMTLQDARQIYEGADDAATQYFRRTMSAPLADDFRPIVEKSLTEVGAIRVYDDAIGEYAKLPFMPDVKADLGQYVIDGSLDGIFHYLAIEEAAIRNDPVKRTTELLQRVFGR